MDKISLKARFRKRIKENVASYVKDAIKDARTKTQMALSSVVTAMNTGRAKHSPEANKKMLQLDGVLDSARIGLVTAKQRLLEAGTMCESKKKAVKKTIKEDDEVQSSGNNKWFAIKSNQGTIYEFSFYCNDPEKAMVLAALASPEHVSKMSEEDLLKLYDDHYQGKDPTAILDARGITLKVDDAHSLQYSGNDYQDGFAVSKGKGNTEELWEDVSPITTVILW